MSGNSRHGSGGFCRVRASPRQHGETRSKIDVGRQRSTVVTATDTRVTKPERSSILIRGLCAQKMAEIRRGEKEPTHNGVFGAQARMRNIAPSSAVMRLLDPFRSW